MGHLLALILAIGLLQSGAAAPKLADKYAALQPEVLITTLAPDKLATTVALEHDTEVARSESVTIVVSVGTCEKGANGSCNVSADVVTYKPDGTVYSEVKNLSVNDRRATAPLPLKASDATGLYKVIATVRDLNARRFGKAERSFGVK